jgi:hypothetical protein
MLSGYKFSGHKPSSDKNLVCPAIAPSAAIEALHFTYETRYHNTLTSRFSPRFARAETTS